MFNFLHSYWGWSPGKGIAPPQIIVIKLYMMEMHFKNVYHLAHTLYSKVFNMFKLFTDCTSPYCCFCYSFVYFVMAVSKSIHLEDLLALLRITKFCSIFCIKTTHR